MPRGPEGDTAKPRQGWWPTMTVAVVLFLAAAMAPLTATAAEPFALPDQITDQVSALEGQTTGVQGALDDLETTDGIRMWVVFVETFDGTSPQAWTDQTFAATGLGVNDYLLAVATTDRQYGYLVDTGFVLDDAALGRVATASERHLAENPARAITEAARAMDEEMVALRSGAVATTQAESGWGLVLVALAIVGGVFIVGPLVVYLAFRGQREGPGSGYGPQDTGSGSSSWWSSSSDHWTSGGTSSGGWSSGGGSGSRGGGGGGGTRGGSGSF